MGKHDSTRWTEIGPGTKPGKILCRCECGTEKQIWKLHFTYRTSTSCGKCGILRNGKKRGLKHGMTGTPEYSAYHAAIQRCENPKCEAFDLYGERGIDMCARWRNSFEAFFADMGLRPADDMSIDRINNETGGYWCGKSECDDCGPANREPNCRWGTDEIQNQNRRDNVNITYNGKTQCVEAWAREVGLKPNVLYGRIKWKWPVEKALFTPVAPYRKGWESPLPDNSSDSS